MESGKQMRFSDSELELIKRTFEGNDDLLLVLRKVFLPEYDPNAPIGQTVDLWSSLAIKQMDPQTAYVHMLARQDLIMHVESQLMQLQILAGMKKETPAERAERQKKDSVK